MCRSEPVPCIKGSSCKNPRKSGPRPLRSWNLIDSGPLLAAGQSDPAVVLSTTCGQIGRIHGIYAASSLLNEACVCTGLHARLYTSRCKCCTSLNISIPPAASMHDTGDHRYNLFTGNLNYRENLNYDIWIIAAWLHMHMFMYTCPNTCPCMHAAHISVHIPHRHLRILVWSVLSWL